MTTNQTIDGVPRELLERIAGYEWFNSKATQNGIERRSPDRAELRALLDAPEQPKAEPVAWTEVDVLDFMSVALRHAEYSGLSPSDILDGLRYMAEKGKPATFTRPDSDEVVRLRCEVSKWRGTAGRLTHERDALRAQPQGKPVAWQYRVSAGPQTGWSLWHDGKGEEFKKSYQVETRPLYTEQPAPASVSGGDE